MMEPGPEAPEPLVRIGDELLAKLGEIDLAPLEELYNRKYIDDICERCNPGMHASYMTQEGMITNKMKEKH